MDTHSAPSPAHWRTLEPLLDAALALPPDRRRSFVDAQYGGDAGMRDEVMTMLMACERLAGDEEFLAQPAAERFASLWEDPGDDARFAAAIAARYVVEGEAGRGGVAVVYRARDVRTGDRVALKALRATLGRWPARFRREIAFAASLQHPHILPVLESGESAGRLWYAMPFVEGETLGARLRREGRIGLPEVVRLLREIADGLAYAHAQGVIHRDLKPDNVLLSDGRAVIADFGIAKALGAATTADASDDGVTTAGVRVGTPTYMAPEQVAADPALDHRIDLYALGVIAYQLIAGRPPFAGSRQAVLTAHCVEPPAPLATHRTGVPERLDRLVMRLLEKNAASRPSSANAVRAELDAISLTRNVSLVGSTPERSGDPMATPQDGLQLDGDPASGNDRVPKGAVVADRYRIEHRIAAGGMATVFLAEDLKHGRQVAVKVLHETLAHTIGIQRFLREIEVIARLQHPHLLTLIDSGDLNGLPFYVMPYIEAQSLRELIVERKQLSFEEAVRITREVADGLTYAHQHSVVHRDIKPSNILMSGGHAVVADFGIATALQRAAVGRLTETGISLGSPTYMSPEQAAGERNVDERSDIYSVACMLYEMLAGQPPIDSASMQQVVTRKLTGTFTKLRDLRPDAPPALEAVIHQALAPDRAARFATMEAFSNAIAAALPAAEGGRRRARWPMVAAAFLAIAAGAAWFQHERRIVRATQRVAEVDRLAIAGDFTSAFRIAEEILPIIPHDSTLRRIRPAFTDFLKIVTVPAGARVSIQRIDQPDSEWKVVGMTPLDSFPLPKLGSGVDYKIRIQRDGYEPAEVLGNLFADYGMVAGSPPLDTLRLDSLGAMPGMARIPGMRFFDGRLQLADFHIAKTEVTNREFARFVAAGGYQKREYWTEPMARQGRPVSWEQAMSEFRDRSGAPGPSTWSGGTYPAGQADFPVGGVSYFEAAAYARFAGKRLPTLNHWRRAAMRGFRETGWIFFRTSNMNAAQPRAVGQGLINAFGLYDVAGNVREWCVNPMGDERTAMGGGWEDAEYLTNNLLSRPEFDRSPSNGLRLMAVSDPDSSLAQLSRPVARTVRRDFRGFTAVSDAEFAFYRRMFDYDRRPIDAKIEAEGVRERFRWQKVSFAGANGGERMIAYVFLPKDARPQYEPVIFWPPGAPLVRKPSVPEGLIFESLVEFIPQYGRALVLPLFTGSYERHGDKYSNVRMSVDSTTQYRDLVVQWVKDLRRTVDYLETRNDMQADRVGYYGVSWGGQMASVALALEPRIKAAVLNTGGYNVVTQPRSEVDGGNYAPRVHTPVLMLSGQHDNAIFPYETSQLPFYQQLGTDTAHKKRLSYAVASHILPQEAVVRETTAWFDRYLSGGARR